MKKLFAVPTLCCALALTAGCGGGDSHWADLHGAVEKGPFVVGSSIAVSLVNERALPTGEVFSSQTTSELGEFALEVQVVEDLQNVSIEGQGFYYNEASGDLSSANLTLRAYGTMTGDSEIYVNLMTHLSYNRIAKLAGEGTGFVAAQVQAEEELQLALGLGPVGFTLSTPATKLNIVAEDTLENAYLLLVSAVIAEHTEGDDARLQELVNTLSLDFADDGQLASPLTMAMGSTQSDLHGDKTMTLFREYLDRIGSSATVGSLHTVLDNDGDGAVNSDDNCRYTDNPDQADSDANGIGNACDFGVTKIAHGWLTCAVVGGAQPGVYCLDYAPELAGASAFVSNVAVFEEAGVFLDVSSTIDINSDEVSVCVIANNKSLQCWSLLGASLATPTGSYEELASHRTAGHCAINTTGSLHCFSYRDGALQESSLVPAENGKSWTNLTVNGQLSMLEDGEACVLVSETGAIECFPTSTGGGAGSTATPTEALSDFDMYEGAGCGINPMSASIDCWGPDGVFSLAGTQVSSAFIDIAVGPTSVCALDADGKAHCWARSADAKANNRIYPTADKTFTSVWMGGTGWDRDVPEICLKPEDCAPSSNACGITGAGALYCWNIDSPL